MEIALPLFPVVADLQTDVGQASHPGDAAEECVDREAPERHPRNAGWQRNEGSHDWQHS